MYVCMYCTLLLVIGPRESYWGTPCSTLMTLFLNSHRNLTLAEHYSSMNKDMSDIFNGGRPANGNVGMRNMARYRCVHWVSIPRRAGEKPPSCATQIGSCMYFDPSVDTPFEVFDTIPIK